MKQHAESSSMALGKFFAGSDEWVQPEASQGGTARNELVDSLYQYLDFQVLLEVFTERLCQSHLIEGLSFSVLDLPLHYERKSISVAESFKLEFQLNHKSLALGQLTLLRSRQFLSSEVRSITALVDDLSGPLHNAVLYARACHSAYRDALTGLYNRAALDKSLLRDPTQDDLSSQPLVLLVCDVDRFKTINDNCGHPVGDEVLRQFSAKLSAITRDGDIVFRYGGDEFVIALVNTSEEGGREFAERVRRSVEQFTLYVDNACINLTTTIGVTALRKDESLDHAFLRADQALLSGKRSGKNKVVWQ